MSHPNVNPRDAAAAAARACGPVDVLTEKQPAAGASVGRNRHALIVDTDPVSGRLCRDVLERMGFEIENVAGGVAAVVAARGRAPNLILMDFQLRDASAGETIGWLRSNQALCSVPIIILGMVDGSRMPTKDRHAMAAVRKPLSADAIERTVRDLCG